MESMYVARFFAHAFPLCSPGCLRVPKVADLTCVRRVDVRRDCNATYEGGQDAPANQALDDNVRGLIPLGGQRSSPHAAQKARRGPW